MTHGCPRRPGGRARRALLGLLPVALAACGSDGGTTPPVDSCLAAQVPYPDQVVLSGDTWFVHDPQIAVEGDTYYVFSTNDGIPILRSTDLLSWTMVGRVFPNQLPPWGPSAVPGVEAPWAPGIQFFNGRYHLYYSLSTFGSQRSVIGLTTNTTLDPDAAGYAWEDQGAVLESDPGDEYNAIDPAVVEAADGGLWLTWGSYWQGIRMRALDPQTGLLSEADDSLYRLARRPGVDAVEAPYIIRRGDYYYLFVSFDSCCQGAQSTYNIRVGRSPDVTGPYMDRVGFDMMLGGGSPVLRSYGRVRGPGHNSVLASGDGFLLVHHFYDALENGVPKLQIRPLLWDDRGWPLSGLPYDGSPPGPPATDVTLPGEWGYWAGEEAARRVELKTDGTAVACNGAGQWSYDPPMLTVQWGEGPATGRIDRSVIAADGRSFVGLEPSGRIVRGFRLATQVH
jgi:arabinan endo-1,5-alpha-L-arabinosidase